MISVLPIGLHRLAFRPGGRPVVEALSATIASRGITAIVGPNGAGKSVTLRLIDGLLRPDAGSVSFGGSRPARAVRRAFVFQKPALVRTSVAANIRIALAPLGLSRGDADERVAEALEVTGLSDRARDAARQLSGGEQQRLALARAHAVRPELLLLDEPTGSLDPGATEEVERLIAAQSHAGVKVILVSHNLGQVSRLAEDVLVLAGGRVVEHGPARQVLAAPHSAEARRYITGELPWAHSTAAA